MTIQSDMPEPTGPARQPTPAQIIYVNVQTGYQPRAARFAHGFWYWVLLGWWWCTLKFLVRVILWLTFWPLGLWRSHVNQQKKQASRIRRGYR